MTKIPFQIFEDADEKIAVVRTAHADNYTILNTVNTSDYFPATIKLYAEIDFFNVDPTKTYLIIVSLAPKNELAQIIHTIHVDFKDVTIKYLSDGLGKARGNFEYNLNVVEEGDYKLTYELLDAKTKEPLDSVWQYLYFVSGDTNE